MQRWIWHRLRRLIRCEGVSSCASPVILRESAGPIGPTWILRFRAG
jgi:hypothetical protein